MLDKKRITTNEAFIILQDLAKSQTEKQGDDKEIKKVFVPILEKHYIPYQPYQPTNGYMCSVLPHTYFHSKHKSQLAKLTYTTCYQLAR
jgi:hypothetical protein